ncbi:hypothetical protein EKO04_003952 [Ascochyta lentis]|uniref:HNH nuclease domain-containing protein n=1 Tax=Ascochyta lentis TaxID=205686 RepID=A0A8H7J8A1_9PLEO|nr:hypothetical protein EKO04_003952 [Ascochyta lentis]
MLLRADLHIAFDKPRFVFVLKLSDGRGIRLVFYLLGSLDEYEHHHYNRELYESKVSADLLFARFAWTLFLLLGAFLSCKEERRLTLWIAAHNQMLSRGFFSAADCERFSQPASRKRSQSPRKRKLDDDVPDSAPVDASSLSAPAISHLAQQWLDSERLRSDPEQSWMQNNAWTELVWAGKSLAGYEVKRWLELSGCEVYDSDAEDDDDDGGSSDDYNAKLDNGSFIP